MSFHSIVGQACSTHKVRPRPHAWKCAETNRWHPLAFGSVLTFSDDLLHGDLVPPDAEAPADEICACVAGSGAAAARSPGTRPRAHQLPTRIEELPHGVEATAEER